MLHCQRFAFNFLSLKKIKQKTRTCIARLNEQKVSVFLVSYKITHLFESRITEIKQHTYTLSFTLHSE